MTPAEMPDTRPTPLRESASSRPVRLGVLVSGTGSNLQAILDAIAAGTLKAMLQGMIARGATIFLTSHVLEIVERLCSHLAIIHQGRLVAQGSLEELRAGVEAQTHLESGNGAGPSGEKLTLEEIFLRIVGGNRQTEELSWLG